MFFQDNNDENEDLVKVCALLIHAAKIDENFSLEEEKIIEQTLLKFKAKPDDLKKIITKAKEIEENSNQILGFTREVKNMSEVNKVKIIEALWQIIYSNNQADIYEMSLMRRLAGLLYIDSKTMGDIKERVKKKNLE
tara:strand:- start:287 stop:697 length:411 start_codon:yes stop_codon:yes gene_type:complete